MIHLSSYNLHLLCMQFFRVEPFYNPPFPTIHPPPGPTVTTSCPYPPLPSFLLFHIPPFHPFSHPSLFFLFSILPVFSSLSHPTYNLAVVSPEPFSASNSSLDYLRGTLGRSYMCREEQTLAVAVNFSLNTFQLQVQPFGLTGDQFGAGTILGVTMGLISGKWLSTVLRLE